MKSTKHLTTTKKSKFYVKVCKIYGMALKAKKELQEINYLFYDYNDIPDEKKVCDKMLERLNSFTEDEFLAIQQILQTIRLEKIEENNIKIAKIREYIDRKTSNDLVF